MVGGVGFECCILLGFGVRLVGCGFWVFWVCDFWWFG